ncbi:hypothetical protein TrRE_jg2392, partial [Triparma retinervis]
WLWNLKWYEKKAVQNAYKAGLPDEYLVDEGGEQSDYSLNMKRTYHFPKLLKDDRDLATSVGWCKAVTIAQEMLKGGDMVLGKPCLVLSARGDEVLDAGDIDKMSDYLLEERRDGKGNEVGGDELLVERVIESTVTELSGHDVLAADSAIKGAFLGYLSLPPPPSSERPVNYVLNSDTGTGKTLSMVISWLHESDPELWRRWNYRRDKMLSEDDVNRVMELSSTTKDQRYGLD